MIQLDSNCLHSSSASPVCWEINISTVRGGSVVEIFKKNNIKMRLQCTTTDLPLCADFWWVAGMNLPLRRSSSPKRLNISSGRQCVHKQPLGEFRREVIQMFFPTLGFYCHPFRRSAYLWIVFESIRKGVGGLWEESAGTVGDQRGCSSDQGGVRQVVHLKRVRQEVFGPSLGFCVNYFLPFSRENEWTTCVKWKSFGPLLRCLACMESLQPRRFWLLFNRTFSVPLEGNDNHRYFSACSALV